jgi:hypothetical protein
MRQVIQLIHARSFLGREHGHLSVAWRQSRTAMRQR